MLRADDEDIAAAVLNRPPAPMVRAERKNCERNGGRAATARQTFRGCQARV